MTKSKSRHWITRSIGYGVSLTLLTVMLLWLFGAFHEKIPSGKRQAVLPLLEGRETIVVREKLYPSFESAVGTVRPIAEAKVGSKILARVKKMHIERAGQSCKKDELLVELDDSGLLARHAEARANEQSAEAALSQSRSDLKRAEELFKQNLVSKEKLDQERTRFKTATAELERAKQAALATKDALSFASIRAPFEGVIVDKLVNEGDLVSPGQPVFSLYDANRLQLVAPVREKLAVRLKVGAKVDVYLEALDKHCEGRIDQIVPEASADSRSFEVKVSGPCSPEVMTGMFGRLRIRKGEAPAIRIPKEALISIGQLRYVIVVGEGDRLLRRFVKTAGDGDSAEPLLEIRAGLAEGERILADARELRTK